MQVDDAVAVLSCCRDRRQQLVEQRIATVNRLHQLLQDLVPGGAARRLTSKKARELLASVRPRDQVGKARKQLALEQLADLEPSTPSSRPPASGSPRCSRSSRRSVAGSPRPRPVMTAAVVLGEAGDVRRFPSKAHFASYTGTAPVDASSGDHVRHRLNRGGNRRLNYALHIAALVQIRHPGPGRDYYLRKRAAGKSPLEAMRCLKRTAVRRRLPRPAPTSARLAAALAAASKTGPGGHSGATLQSSASGPTPAASPSDKSLPGPAAPDATPALTALPAPCLTERGAISLGLWTSDLERFRSHAVCSGSASAGRTRRLPTRRRTLLTRWSPCDRRGATRGRSCRRPYAARTSACATLSRAGFSGGSELTPRR